MRAAQRVFFVETRNHHRKQNRAVHLTRHTPSRLIARENSGVALRFHCELQLRTRHHHKLVSSPAAPLKKPPMDRRFSTCRSVFHSCSRSPALPVAAPPRVRNLRTL